MINLPPLPTNSSAGMPFANVTVRHWREGTPWHPVPLPSPYFASDRTDAGWIGTATVSVSRAYVVVVAHDNPVAECVSLGPPWRWPIKATDGTDIGVEHVSTSNRIGWSSTCGGLPALAWAGLADGRKQGPPSGWQGACDDTDRSLQAYPKEARSLTSDLPVG